MGDIKISVMNRNKPKREIPRNSIYITNTDLDYITDEIMRWYHIKFKIKIDI